MQWNDKAIVLSLRRLGEHSGIVQLLSKDHGLYGGVDRGAFGKRKRGIYQPGNIVSAHWQARLPEQLGTINCELTVPVAAHVIGSHQKLAALNSATLMIQKILPERDAHTTVFDALEQFTQALRHDDNWLLAYVLLEFTLLEHAGFGLDLASCAATGSSEDLIYVSPRSGRAVSREAGLPYHDRLFALPQFLQEREQINEPNVSQVLEGIRLCGHFLQERVFVPRGTNLPLARHRLLELLQAAH